MLTDRVAILGIELESVIKDAQEELGLRKVWYGDDDSIPETPAVLVSPDSKTRTLTNTGNTTMVDFQFYITVFHSRLGSPEVTRKDCDELAESLEEVLHRDKTVRGNLIHSFVSSMEYGVARRGQVVMKATRLLWTGKSQTRI